MTPLNLDAIEARANAATPGPWGVSDRLSAFGDLTVAAPWRGANGAEIVAKAANGPNTTFIAASRTDVPALVAEVRRLRQEVGIQEAARMRGLIDSHVMNVRANDLPPLAVQLAEDLRARARGEAL